MEMVPFSVVMIFIRFFKIALFKSHSNVGKMTSWHKNRWVPGGLGFKNRNFEPLHVNCRFWVSISSMAWYVFSFSELTSFEVNPATSISLPTFTLITPGGKGNPGGGMSLAAPITVMGMIFFCVSTAIRNAPSLKGCSGSFVLF